VSIDLVKATALQQTLQEQITDGSWRKVLQILAVTGVADNQQLIQASGLNRDRLRRMLDKMIAASSGYPPLFSVYDRRLKRGGVRGASVRIYRLGESGAALCKLDGMKDAHPCQLEEPRAVMHALGILDVHLAARASGWKVVTDQNLNYAEGGSIRPDNLITLADGTQAIFESEQDARSEFLQRMLRSLSHKVAFFGSEESREVSPVVRMLIDLPRGKLWQQTLNTWSRALGVSRETHASLPFRLLAMPLSEFLARPDWSSEPETGRWVDLGDHVSAVESANSALSEVPDSRIPEFSSRERRVILAALYEMLKENVAKGGQRQADIDFLYSMRLIYSASHDPFLDPLQRGGVPYDSLFLLNQYLLMNPALREQIEETIQVDARRIHWNQSTALHRMQVVVDTFLEYHGWQSEGPLCAYSYTPDYQARGPRHFSIAVEITEPEILIPQETGVAPRKEEVRYLADALAWVLTSLFAASHHLGLKKAPFW
jgi:hypothetical protein